MSLFRRDMEDFMLYCELTKGSTIQMDETSHNLGRYRGL